LYMPNSKFLTSEFMVLDGKKHERGRGFGPRLQKASSQSHSGFSCMPGSAKMTPFLGRLSVSSRQTPALTWTAGTCCACCLLWRRPRALTHCGTHTSSTCQRHMVSWSASYIVTCHRLCSKLAGSKNSHQQRISCWARQP